MKQANFKSISDSHQNIIYPVYSNQNICSEIIERLEFNLNNIVNKEYNQITVIHTLRKYSFDTITFIGLGDSKKIASAKMRKAFASISKKK